MTKEQQDKEWIKLVAIFLAMEEQATVLIGLAQREQKMVFNEARKQMSRLARMIEKESDNEYLDALKDRIHESIKQL